MEMKCKIEGDNVIVYSPDKETTDKLKDWYASGKGCFNVDTSLFDKDFDAKIEYPYLFNIE